MNYGHKKVFNNWTQIFKFASAEFDQIFKKIESVKSSKEVENDKNVFSNILNDAKNKFDRQWEERKLVLTREAKFRIFLSEIDTLSNNLDVASNTLNVRTSLDENAASVNSATKFVEHFEQTTLRVSRDLNIMIRS